MTEHQLGKELKYLLKTLKIIEVTSSSQLNKTMLVKKLFEDGPYWSLGGLNTGRVVGED